ncbi:MAG: flagellar hook protein FlgE [Dissulfurimicrobium hydrothermale]|uniref:flagellar hook protein FlgE n=1 Tax=Dissulfurimicrobium hydrothermale TaxID=1750598 RepID=UPI003C768903
MSLTSSLYSGVNGLTIFGNAMQVIGDNISNVNTTGFKASRATFQDIMAQSINTARGGSQVGRGAAMADVAPIFQQGSFESTSSPTDLAIAGNGFFVVKNPNTGNTYYTRAGQFRTDQYGNLVNPAGMRVQGWKMDPDKAQIVGAPTDIKISSTSPPVATKKTTVAVNLDSTTVGPSPSPLTWDGSGTPADPNGKMAQGTNYQYSTSLNVYDSLGNTHTITIYFDKADTNADGKWNFLVAMNPNEDQSGDTTATRGELMEGQITFNAQGNIDSSNTSITITGLRDNNGEWNTSPTIDQYMDTNGYLKFNAYFLPKTTGGPTDPALQTIDLDLGTQAQVTTSGTPPAVTAIDKWNTEAITTTQYAARSSTIFYDQDGFASGFLETLSVDNDGKISGSYSNGRIVPLAQLELARFNSPTDLSKAGGNLWQQTTASGAPITGPPNTNGLGSVTANALEQSTVDIGTEFVRLITTQRAFQANSKLITTTDQMLSELLNMKQ